MGWIRSSVGTAADVIQIGSFVALLAGIGLLAGVLVWLKTTTVALWVLAAVVSALLLAVAVAYWIGRRRSIRGAGTLPPAAAAQVQQAAEHLRVSTEQSEAVLRLLYDALESIQQELAIAEPWGLDDLVERGVLGPVRGLLIRRPQEDVRLSVLVPRDDPPTRFRMRWAAGHRPESVRNYERAIDETFAGRAFRTNDFVVYEDVLNDSAFVPNPRATREIRSLVAAPVRVGDRACALGGERILLSRLPDATMATWGGGSVPG